MSPMNEEHMAHQPKIRKRARAVSWGFAPLALLGIAVWFLFNAIVCMGGGAQPVTLFVCDWANILPDLLVAAVVLSLIWLVLAVRDLGIATGGPDLLADKKRIRRETAATRHAYRQLDSEYRQHVWIALEMAAWTTAVSIGTLVYYWLEIAFPLGIIVLAGLLTLLIRLIRRSIVAIRRGPPRGEGGLSLPSSGSDKPRGSTGLSAG
ncbi:hypothetical protein [Nitrospira moscoviensis]|uniref:Uncharacterized protein n=1 Tax=Nitrospira moscoviensis TaxID=42253 RepID=A0A0K2GA29_NITMO|nr:hypothetical protein [Nitrospira moscoviensis]ALA57808.1 membrane protein of unknown function [Nitrospira moscoviensis]